MSEQNGTYTYVRRGNPKHMPSWNERALMTRDNGVLQLPTEVADLMTGKFYRIRLMPDGIIQLQPLEDTAHVVFMGGKPGD